MTQYSFVVEKFNIRINVVSLITNQYSLVSVYIILINITSYNTI